MLVSLDARRNDGRVPLGVRSIQAHSKLAPRTLAILLACSFANSTVFMRVMRSKASRQPAVLVSPFQRRTTASISERSSATAGLALSLLNQRTAAFPLGLLR